MKWILRAALAATLLVGMTADVYNKWGEKIGMDYFNKVREGLK